MKIRNGFVSNSSSSSFILSNVNVEEVINFCKECYTNKIKKQLEEYNQKIKNLDKVETFSSYNTWSKEQYIKMYQDDIQRLEYYLPKINDIKIDKVKDIKWDLSEWFDNLNPEDLVLYDEDNNILNYIGEEIVEKFNVEKYCLHM